MSASPESPPRIAGAATAHDRVLLIGVLVWVAVMIALWPLATSFGDEVGYIGEARLVLAGRFRPLPGDLGIWQPGAGGLVAKYPLFPSLLMAPLFATSPRAVFALGIASAVAVCLLAGRVLRSWGDSSAWALIVLAHPTVVIIARTATADVPLCALMLGAWWALRRDRFRAAVPLLAALFAIKATGFLIGGAIIGGEIWRRLPALRRREPHARRALAYALLGGGLGVCLVVAANVLTTGGPWFGYSHESLTAPPFWFSHFPRTAPEQLRTVLILPPLLFLGAVPYWRMREPAPLLVIVGFGSLMCFYFFVDSGTNRLETWVLAPRLLLPVVVFLLVGYGHLLAGLMRRWRALDQIAGGVLIAMTVTLALAVSSRHHRWQIPMGEALEAAQRIAGQTGVRELGVLEQAAKAGVLFPGRVRLVASTEAQAALVLCSDHAASYRQRDREGPYSCRLPGHHAAHRGGGFEVLVRDDAQR